MENKQIIIDGVNVCECECFYINDSHPERKECINPYCKGLCKDNPNCCFKQLKRKEQECEELKEKAKELRQGWIDCDKERNLQEANSEFRQRVINRYKQTLDEIKEAAENVYCLTNCTNKDMAQFAKQILQKISECKGEYNEKIR